MSEAQQPPPRGVRLYDPIEEAWQTFSKENGISFNQAVNMALAPMLGFTGDLSKFMRGRPKDERHK